MLLSWNVELQPLLSFDICLRYFIVCFTLSWATTSRPSIEYPIFWPFINSYFWSPLEASSYKTFNLWYLLLTIKSFFLSNVLELHPLFYVGSILKCSGHSHSLKLLFYSFSNLYVYLILIFWSSHEVSSYNIFYLSYLLWTLKVFLVSNVLELHTLFYLGFILKCSGHSYNLKLLSQGLSIGIST